ncbi:MAG: tetratricopeptide repeat protein [Helicobacteraceae bacterium]|nr:tetratricopeptide repeat protein [Helicobacteraceae bacterium]
MIAGRRLCEAKSSIPLLDRVCDNIKRFSFVDQTPQKFFAPIARAFFIDKLSKIAPIALIALSASIPLFGASAAEEAFNQGVSAYNHGAFEEAIKHYDQAIKIDPNYAIAYDNRGNARANLGDISRAIADHAQAIKIDPNLASAYDNRGNAYANLGDLSRAIADHNQAIKIDPNYADAYNNRGVAYVNLGDLKSATKDARKACELGACQLLQIMEQNQLIRD